jgi:hypothetical protein
MATPFKQPAWFNDMKPTPEAQAASAPAAMPAAVVRMQAPQPAHDTRSVHARLQDIEETVRHLLAKLKTETGI